jgi:phosphopentomutase
VRPRPLGVRDSFCDLGQSVATALGIAPLARGVDLWSEVVA